MKKKINFQQYLKISTVDHNMKEMCYEIVVELLYLHTLLLCILLDADE